MTTLDPSHHRLGFKGGLHIVCATAFGLALATVPSAASAGDTPQSVRAPIVVEQFTSQSCPKCPPADAFLVELAGHDDVIALSLPVDMWDFMGSKDELAKPEHTKRHKAYNKRLRGRSAFTPQVIIDGTDFEAGSRRTRITDIIEDHRINPGYAIPVDATVNNGIIRAEIGQGLPGSAPATVYLFAYRSHWNTEIKSGANKGRAIDYANVVFAIEDLGTWTGGPLTVSAPVPSDEDGPPEGLALIVQTDGLGPIVGAAQIDLTAPAARQDAI